MAAYLLLYLLWGVALEALAAYKLAEFHRVGWSTLVSVIAWPYALVIVVLRGFDQLHTEHHFRRMVENGDFDDVFVLRKGEDQ